MLYIVIVMYVMFMAIYMFIVQSHSVVSAGLLSDVKGLGVTAVSLGKAHGVLLTNKGHVYTFGLNNKGQCGREFVSSGAAKECKLLGSCACLNLS